MIFDILKNIKKEIATLFICIVIASAFIVFLYDLKQIASQQNRFSETNLKQARENYYTARYQRALFDAFESDYISLKNNNIIGSEDRLNWINNLDKISRQNKIPYLKYKISKRQKLSLENISQPYPDIDLYKSSMLLQLQLLHEGDLHTVLDLLNDKSQGLFDIYSCTISRNPTQNKSIIPSQTENNFTANCTLNWYTIQKTPLSINKTENI